ncbi:MAG TPA: acyl-CoA dehydrogenase family protein [Thermodesulfobacteriota bacterium]|nr:acyl-CoA dehydrogenase family protein [Thermodesulfobacteriota bacterium]
MNFSLTEEQRMVQQTARDFALEKLAPRAAEIDATRNYPLPILKEMADLGLMGMNILAEYGGSQAGVISYSLAITEVGKACASTAVAMSVTNMVAEIIQAFGTEDQRNAHIPRICSGEYASGAFALTEAAAGSDPSSMKTSAEPAGDFYVLNGSKIFITSAEHAGVFVVWAKTRKAEGSRGVSAFLVEQGHPGFRIGRNEEKMGQLGSCTNEIAIEDCRLPRRALLGNEGDGFRIAMMALDGGRIGVGSLAVGIGSAAIEYAAEYAKQRVQFGKPIASFQAIQWMIADSATELEAARLMVLRAADLKEKGRRFTREASMAKLLASETANRVCYKALQILGGYGYSKEYPLERYARDCRVTAIYEGTSEIQRLVIAREVLGL